MMRYYVVDDLQGSGLAVIGCDGFVPSSHYGTPPSHNGRVVLDGSKLRKRRVWSDPSTGELQFTTPPAGIASTWQIDVDPDKEASIDDALDALEMNLSLMARP